MGENKNYMVSSFQENTKPSGTCTELLIAVASEDWLF